MPITAQAAGVKAGAIADFAGSTAPAGWLICDGSAISRTLYSALFSYCGTSHGAGDGSTTFNIPDCRGEFRRGLDNGRGVDTERTLGSAQTDSYGSHTHTGSTDTHAGHAHNTGSGSLGGSTTGGSSYVSTGGATTGSAGAHSHALTIAASGATETKPRNKAFLTCIKF